MRVPWNFVGDSSHFRPLLILTIVLAGLSVLFWFRGRRPRMATRPNGGPERRRQLRQPCGSRAVEVADVQGQTKTYRAWVLDLSSQGMCLTVEEPLEPGTILRLRPPQVDNVVYWVPVWVRHCRKAEGGWEVGCKLLQKINRRTLQRFV